MLVTDGVSESNVLAYLAEIEKVRRYTTITYLRINSQTSLQNKSYNALYCLHLFTKKTTEIISAFVTNDFDEDEGTISPDVRSPANERTAKTKANFNLPSVKDAPAGEGDRPWTFDELRSSLCS